MQVTVDADATLKWANFSGDFDAIHFDLGMARASGSDRLVAHGMNALLNVHQTVEAASPPRNGWRRVDVLMLQPIPQGRPVTVGIRALPGGVAFDLRDEATRYLQGTTRGIVAPLSHAMDPSQLRREISPDRLQRKCHEFAASFPDVARRWIFLDALVFSDFLCNEFNRSAAGLERLGSRRRVVLQTSHRLLFDPAGVERLFADEAPLPRLVYTVARPEGIRTAEGDFDTVEITTFADDQIVLQQEVGLLARAAGSLVPVSSMR